MDEQAQQLVTDAGEKVLAWLDATEGFAIEQAPLLAQEIVRYGIFYNAAMLLIPLVLAVLFGGLSYRAGTAKGTWEEGSPKAVICVICGVFAGFMALVLIIVGLGKHLPAFFKATLAPRLYILEQIGRLL